MTSSGPGVPSWAATFAGPIPALSPDCERSRSARRRAAREIGFVRKRSNPAAWLQRRVSSSSCDESAMSTAPCLPELRSFSFNARAASKPFMTGMSRSMSTTSGRVASATATASRPLTAVSTVIGGHGRYRRTTRRLYSCSHVRFTRM
jgi:hypothetical protein